MLRSDPFFRLIVDDTFTLLWMSWKFMGWITALKHTASVHKCSLQFLFDTNPGGFCPDMYICKCLHLYWHIWTLKIVWCQPTLMHPYQPTGSVISRVLAFHFLYHSTPTLLLPSRPSRCTTAGLQWSVFFHSNFIENKWWIQYRET